VAGPGVVVELGRCVLGCDGDFAGVCVLTVGVGERLMIVTVVRSCPPETHSADAAPIAAASRAPTKSLFR